jgi:hypothetical protein
VSQSLDDPITMPTTGEAVLKLRLRLVRRQRCDFRLRLFPARSHPVKQAT